MVWVNTSPLVKTYTLEEFWALPEPPDHSKLELIAGVLYLTPAPGYTHDKAVSSLLRLLTEHLMQAGYPGTLYVPRAAIWTSPNTYLEPDLFYVSAETEAILDPEHRTTAALDVKELWLVDETAETIEVRQQTAKTFADGVVFTKGENLRSSVLPDLSLDVRSPRSSKLSGYSPH